MQRVTTRHQVWTLLLVASCLITTAAAAQTISFSASGLKNVSLSNPTSLQFGPDGRLYISQQNAVIHALTVVRTDVNDYSVVASEQIDLIKNGVPNHNDDGGANATQQRQVTGIHVADTPAQPVVYVTSSDWRIQVGADSGLDTNSGVLTRLTCTGGIQNDVCQAWEAVDLVRGLPRSEENHSTNGLDLDAVNNILYVMQGGHANKGAPSNSFSGTPEYYLSAAMLSVDLGALASIETANGGPYTDPRTGRAFVYDLPTLDDPTRTNLLPTDAGYPYGAGHPWYGQAFDAGDPFGGNNGLNQAIPEPGGPVQVHSPGYRNAYDVVVHSSGDIYTWDNGPNGGWGGTSLVRASDGTLKGYYGQSGVTFDAGAGDYCTNEMNEDGSGGHGDVLRRVTAAGDFGGHQTPIRAFPTLAGIYNFIEVSDGNWQQQTGLPVFQMDELVPQWLLDAWQTDFATAFPDNPVECVYSANQDQLETVSASTNGLAEYRASNFEGAMQGDLLAASFNGNVYRCKPDGSGGLIDLPGSTSGTSSGLCEVLAGGFGSQPLDVTAQADGDPFAGTIWAATYGANNITIFEPQDFGACDVTDPLADADNDGYSNGDEADNGTNPCSGSSKPLDNDGDLVSDLNDPDDDGDGIPDVSDAFALDPDNGLATSLPVSYPFFNNDPGTGLFGLGFTGLMLPPDGSKTWLDLYDEEKLAAGGTAGLMTVEEVTLGDAYQSNNTQENAFLFGVNVDDGTAPFIIHSRLLPPFFAVDGSATTPKNFQSFGIFIGTGDQDNYLKVVVNANGGAGGIEVLAEAGGLKQSGSQYGNSAWGGVSILGDASVDLFLEVDPAAATVQPRVAIGQGTVFDLGTPVSVPAAWFDANDAKGLAIGLISTAFNSGTPFSATWDFIDIDFVPSDAKALVQVTPNGGINASTFGSDSFIIENLSTSAAISSVVIDVSTAVLPDLVFDPNGTAGDLTSKDLTIDGQTGDTGFDTHTFGSAHDGGFQTLTLEFAGFDPGEAIRFSVDMDPTSINGTTAPGPGESGSVSGLELSGSTVTVTFDDGTVHTTSLFRGPGETMGGSETLARSPVPAQPVLTVPGLTLDVPADLPAHFRTGTTGSASQTLHVDAPVGATVRLLQLDAALFEPAGGGFDVDAFEANSVVAVQEQSATVASPSGVDFSVSLTALDATTGAAATYNYFVAVVEDETTGPVSDVVILSHDPSATPSPLFRVNAGGPLLAAIDNTGVDWVADQGTGGSAYLVAGGTKVNGFTGGTLDATVPSTAPASLFDTERWDDPLAPEMLWSFPTGSGEFVVRLYMMNGYSGTSTAGQRVFDVNIEGGPLEIDDLDLSGQHGHLVGVTYEFPITVADGALEIEFLHQTENPLVNAIEILGFNLPNRPPLVAAVGDQVNREGDTPDLTVSASDPDGDNLTFSATGLPPGLDLESTNGHVFGTIAEGAVAGSPYSVTVSVSDGTNPPAQTSFMWTVFEPATAGILYRINVGGELVADAEKNWSTDAGLPFLTAGGADTYSDASSNAYQGPVVLTHPSLPAGTPEAIFKTERYDVAAAPEMTWSFPVPTGTAVELRLFFAEIFSGIDTAGERVFDVEVEGVVPAAFDDIDPFATAGAKGGFMLAHQVTVTDGSLDVVFLHGIENPNVKAIEVRVQDGVVPGVPQALIAVTPGAGLTASTFNNNAFQISNPGEVAITGVVIDLSTAILPDMVFDPVGTAGDAAGKCLTPNTVTGSPGYVAPSDPCVTPFGQPHNGVDGDDGYDAVTLAFTDLDPGEGFNFSVDIDPTSIKGDSNTGDAGAVSGLELAGSTVTVTFADGSTHSGSLFEDGSLGGAYAIVGPDRPAAPGLAVAGIVPPAVVTEAAQTLTVTGPPGADVVVLQLDARLYIDDPNLGGGYDIDPFEANEAVVKALYTATLDGAGTADIAVTLLRTAGSNGAPDAGLNHFVAAVLDADAEAGRTSDAIVIEYDPTAGQSLAISGSVTHGDTGGTPLAGAALALTGDDAQSATSAVDGTFTFSVDAGGSYSVAASKSGDEPLSGVTTLDLYLMQQHVLSVAPLADPLALLAADVNGSASVTSLDVYETQQVILQTTPAFAGGFWRCIVAGQTFNDPSQPFGAEETHTFAGLTADATADFTCFVRGDADASWTPPSAGKGSAIAADGEGPPLRFEVDNQATAPDAEIEVPVRVSGFSDIGGYQFTLSWDPAVLSFEAVEPAELPGLNAGNFGTHRVEEGLLTTAWIDPFGGAETLDDGAALFNVRFRVVGSEGAASAVSVGSAVTPRFAHRGRSLRPVTVLSVDGEVDTRELPQAYLLEQAYPNPFNPQTTIRYALPQAAHVRLSVFDAVGRQVAVLLDEPKAAGAHDVVFEASALPSGVYFYRIEAGSFQSIRRVTLVK